MKIALLLLLKVSQHALAVVVEVYEGEDSILLPCLYSGFTPENNPTVTWTRHDLDPKSAHLRREAGDDLRGQHQRYSGRTSMTPDALDTRDFSLTLAKPKQADSSNYACTITDGKKEWRLTEVQLQVKERFPPWATAVLLILVLVLVVSGGLIYNFRHYFMSGYKVEVDSRVESVQLPCKTTVCLPKDAKVEWKNSGHRTVHMYKNTSLKNRTSFT